jgi:hypothetical protein
MRLIRFCQNSLAKPVTLVGFTRNAIPLHAGKPASHMRLIRFWHNSLAKPVALVGFTRQAIPVHAGKAVSHMRLIRIWHNPLAKKKTGLYSVKDDPSSPRLASKMVMPNTDKKMTALIHGSNTTNSFVYCIIALPDNGPQLVPGRKCDPELLLESVLEAVCAPARGVDVRQPALQVVLDDQLDCAFHAPRQKLLGEKIFEVEKRS